MSKLIQSLTTGLIATTALLSMSSCTVESTSLTGRPKSNKVDMEYSANFAFAPAQRTFEQARFDRNEIDVLFKVEKDGVSINDLTAQDIQIFDGDVEVTPFKLEATSKRQDMIADIVFVVDRTWSMAAFIETAKQRLEEFINTTRANGYRTRMCFSTFGDYTDRHCSEFWDNNPYDSDTETQVTTLISELTKLHSAKDPASDPGYPTLDENPMRALVDATKAPWASGSQRFVILVTDAAFHYGPDNPTPQSGEKYRAPDMKEVNEAIEKSQITVFAVTPSLPGFNSDFQGQPSIVEASGGEFFEFSEVLSGKITLDSILDRILYSIDTTYKATYVADDVEGLDPTIALSDRDIDIQVLSPAEAKVIVQAKHSSLPEGRAKYQDTWKVAESAIRKDMVKVSINGKDLDDSQYEVEGGHIQFKDVPVPGARIKINYSYEANGENLRLSPMILPAQLNESDFEVYLNDKLAKVGDIILERDLNNQNSLSIADSVLGPADPYGISEHQGLSVKVRVTKLQQPNRRQNKLEEVKQ